MNVVAKMEFELLYNVVAVQQVTRYATGSPPSILTILNTHGKEKFDQLKTFIF